MGLLDHLGHGESFARAGDTEQHLGAIVAAHAFDQIGNGLRLIALRIEVGFDDQWASAFGFFRSRWPVRHPDFVGAVLLAKFGAAFAEQLVERLLAGEAGDRSDFARSRTREAQMSRTHVGRDHVPCVLWLTLLLIDAERVREIGIEFARRHRRFADITLLRRFAETAGHRSPRRVRIGEVGTAVERVVGRRRNL